jgi:hypothetical protein
MVWAFWRNCILCVALAALCGCRGRSGLPPDPLLIARSPVTGQAMNSAPVMIAHVAPTPPPAPVEMQERPSLAKYRRPAPLPDTVGPGPGLPGVLTNRPRSITSPAETPSTAPDSRP